VRVPEAQRPLTPPTTPPPVLWDFRLAIATHEKVIESPAQASLYTRTVNPAMLPNHVRLLSTIHDEAMLSDLLTILTPLARAKLTWIGDTALKHTLDAQLAQGSHISLITADHGYPTTILSVAANGDLELMVCGIIPTARPQMHVPTPLPGRVHIAGRPRPVGDAHNPICLVRGGICRVDCTFQASCHACTCFISPVLTAIPGLKLYSWNCLKK
jgi:hypothetical protein